MGRLKKSERKELVLRLMDMIGHSRAAKDYSIFEEVIDDHMSMNVDVTRGEKEMMMLTPLHYAIVYVNMADGRA